MDVVKPTPFKPRVSFAHPVSSGSKSPPQSLGRPQSMRVSSRRRPPPPEAPPTAGALSLMRLVDPGVEASRHAHHDFEVAVSKSALNFLDSLDDASLNIVSVFGGAGTGKSTLMNHITGAADLFTVGHDLSKPCTRGVDISTQVLPWEVLDTPDFPDPSLAVPSPSGVNVGFVDAEGQGDRDTKYDTMLFAPVILVSKAVLLNIREGRLQKNSILEKLDVLQTVVSKLHIDGAGAAGDDSEPWLGHLHIVIRDWISGESRVQVQRLLMGDEVPEAGRCLPEDAKRRNAIRRDIFTNFASVNVWLLPPPVESTRATADFTTRDLTPRYVDVLRQLRHSIASQVQTPTRFHGRALTARSLGALLPIIAESLNTADGTIFPNSVVDGILTAEAQALRRTITQQFEEFCRATSKGGTRRQPAVAAAIADTPGGDAPSALQKLELRRREAGVHHRTQSKGVVESKAGEEESKADPGVLYPPSIEVFGDTVQVKGKALLRQFMELGTDRRAVRAEAEGAAADLLRVARLHAKDHKERLRHFLLERMQAVKDGHAAAVSDGLAALPKPCPAEDVKAVFAAAGGSARAEFEHLWATYPKVIPKFAKTRKGLEADWEDQCTAEVDARTVRLAVDHGGIVEAIAVSFDDTWKSFSIKAAQHFVGGEALKAVSGAVFMHHNGSYLRDDWRVLDLELAKGAHVTLAILRMEDWALSTVREQIGRLWLLLSMDTVRYPELLSGGFDAMAAKLEVAPKEWETNPTMTTILQEGAYTVAADVFKREDMPPDVIRAALEVVWRLCRNSNNRLALVDAGASRTVAAVLRRRRGDAAIVEAAARTLSNLASNSGDTQLSVVEAGVVPVMVEAMVSGIDSAGLQEAGCALLAVLAAHASNKDGMGQGGVLEAVLAAMKHHSGDADVVHCAAAAVANMVAGHRLNQDALGALRGTKDLVACLPAHARDERVQDSVCRALANLCARHAHNREAMVACGTVKQLIATLKAHSACAHVQDSAIRALANLAVEAEVKEGIAEEGGVGVLVATLRTHLGAHPEVVHCAAAAVANLASVKAVQSDIVDMGGADVLVEVLRRHGDNARCVDSAARALTNIASCPEYQNLIVRAGGVPPLVACLAKHPANATVQDSVCRALGNVAANNSDTHGAIIAEGGVGELTAAMMRHQMDPSVCLSGAAALGNLASCGANQVRIASEGGIGALVTAMTHHRRVQAVQSRAARALALIAEDATNASLIAQSDASRCLEIAATLHTGDQAVLDWVKVALYRVKVARRSLAGRR